MRAMLIALMMIASKAWNRSGTWRRTCRAGHALEFALKVGVVGHPERRSCHTHRSRPGPNRAFFAAAP
jgi:hypothetical protein